MMCDSVGRRIMTVSAFGMSRLSSDMRTERNAQAVLKALQPGRGRACLFR